MDNSIYSNGFRVSTSLFETQILFRIDSPQFDENDNFTGCEREDVADIRLSPELARKLRDSLTENLNSYEESRKKKQENQI